METKSLTPGQVEEHQKWIHHFESKYGFVFLEPSFDKVPFASKLFEHEIVKEYTKDIEDYLLGTYPIDMGTNIHSEMNKLRRDIFSNEEYEWHKYHNKLGVNRFGAILLMSTGRINRGLKRDDLFILNHFPVNYYKLSFDEKVNLIRNYDKRAFEFLEKLHNEYPKT